MQKFDQMDMNVELAIHNAEVSGFEHTAQAMRDIKVLLQEARQRGLATPAFSRSSSPAVLADSSSRKESS